MIFFRSVDPEFCGVSHCQLGNPLVSSDNQTFLGDRQYRVQHPGKSALLNVPAVASTLAFSGLNLKEWIRQQADTARTRIDQDVIQGARLNLPERDTVVSQNLIDPVSDSDGGDHVSHFAYPEDLVLPVYPCQLTSPCDQPFNSCLTVIGH